MAEGKFIEKVHGATAEPMGNLGSSNWDHAMLCSILSPQLRVLDAFIAGIGSFDGKVHDVRAGCSFCLRAR